MTFITHNDDPSIDVDGTCLQGMAEATYNELVALFGKPILTKSEGAETDAEWLLQFEDGVVATLYNWKDGKNYLGPCGKPTKRITHWHIGGRQGEDARERVLALLDASRKEAFE